MSESLRNSEHAMNPLLQEVPSLRLANIGRIWSGTGNETQEPRMWQLRPVVHAKDGNVRGIDCPVRGVWLWAFAVLLIHPIIDEGLIESAGSTKHLLLCSGSAEDATTGLDSVGEVQGKRPQPAVH